VLVKVFTLRFDPRSEAFDDAGLRQFLSDKEVLEVRDQFFTKDGAPYWGVLVTYNLPMADGEPGARADLRPARTDYRSLLRPEDWPLFNALRDWRSGRAKEEGVPPYVVVANEPLARAARERPGSLAALGRIRGVGEATLRKHGKGLLAALGRALREAGAAPAPEGPEAPEEEGPAADAPPDGAGEEGSDGG